MTQEHAPVRHHQPDKQDVENTAKKLRDETLDQTIDDLLDEIDGVLEENAEEFVNGFVQKGGE